MRPKPNPIRIVHFRCDNPTYREYDKWGFKVFYNETRVYKTGYDYETREEMHMAAKAFVMAEFPGCWRDKGGRRVR